MLHVPKHNMINVLNKLSTALKQGGILYTSFKYGQGEIFRNGRLFSNFDEDSETLVKRADDNLYKAKHSGRNRILG